MTCTNCGEQGTLEHQTLPMLRTKDWSAGFNFTSGVFKAEFIVETPSTSTFVRIPFDDELRIGNLSALPIVAYYGIQNVFVKAFADGSVATPGNFLGSVYYVDVQSKRHILGAFGGTLATIGAVLCNSSGLQLVADTRIAQQKPANLGQIELFLDYFTLGTIDAITFTVEYNYEVYYATN